MQGRGQTRFGPQLQQCTGKCSEPAQLAAFGFREAQTSCVIHSLTLRELQEQKANVIVMVAHPLRDHQRLHI